MRNLNVNEYKNIHILKYYIKKLFLINTILDAIRLYLCPAAKYSYRKDVSISIKNTF